MCHVQIVVSLVNGRPGSKNFTYSPVLRDFTKATNIRLRFLRTNTLLGHLISKAQRDPTVTRRVRRTLYKLTRRCQAGSSCFPIWGIKIYCPRHLPSSFLFADTNTLTCSLLLTHSSSSRPSARSVCPLIVVIHLAELVEPGLDGSRRLQVQNMALLLKAGEHMLIKTCSVSEEAKACFFFFYFQVVVPGASL